jgi:hypothetical protein
MCKKLSLMQAKLFVIFYLVMVIRPKFSGVLPLAGQVWRNGRKPHGKEEQCHYQN